MDLEMKKVKREDLIEGETMTGAEEEKYVSWLKEHFHLAMVDAVFTYDQPEIDVSEDFLKNLARTYVNAATQDFSEAVCGAGTYVVLVHVKSILRALLHGEVDEDNHPVDDIKLLSGCRPNKFSLHLMMDRIYCDRFLLSMPIIVSEIARFWSIDNAYWLLTHQHQWNTPLGKFRIRALMMEDMVTNQGFYRGVNDTLWDELFYTYKRFCRTIGAVKPGCVYPLHPIPVPKNLRDMKATFIRPNLKFCDTYGPNSIDLNRWRSYTLYGGPHYSDPESRDISGWTPHELFPHIDYFRDRQHKVRASPRPYKESVLQQHFVIVREDDLLTTFSTPLLSTTPLSPTLLLTSLLPTTLLPLPSPHPSFYHTPAYHWPSYYPPDCHLPYYHPPSYDPPSYNPPYYHPPSYYPSSYNLPYYHLPSYHSASYHLPSYQPPSYDPPS